MSKATSPRAARRDWAALLEAAVAADRPLTDEEHDLARRGLIDAGATASGPDYVHALQRAVEGRDPAALLALLDAGAPLPAFLLPALADALRAETQGSTGRPTGLTAAQDRAIRSYADLMGSRDMLGPPPPPPKPFVPEVYVAGRKRKPRPKPAKVPRLEVGGMHSELAEIFGVSTDTIKRSLRRTAAKS